MTSDAGVMLLGATDRKLGLIAAAARCIADPFAQRQAHHRAAFNAPCAAVVQSLRAVAPGERQQAQTGAVGMLGMGLALEQLLHRGQTGHANALSPGNEPLGRPLGMVLVALDYGGEAAFVDAAHVTGHAPSTVLGLHRMDSAMESVFRGQPQFMSFVSRTCGRVAAQEACQARDTGRAR